MKQQNPKLDSNKNEKDHDYNYNGTRLRGFYNRILFKNCKFKLIRKLYLIMKIHRYLFRLNSLSIKEKKNTLNSEFFFQMKEPMDDGE